MNLLLKEALVRSKRTELEFFQMCFFWKFKKNIACTDDTAQYILHGVIPKYVLEWLKFKYEV